jgi:hypothetical protein
LADTLEKNKNAADELIAKQRQAAASAQKDEVETNLKKVSQAADALGTLKDTSDELKPIYYQTLRQQAIAAKMPGAEQLPLTWNPQAAQMVDALHGQALTAKDRIEAGLQRQQQAEAARHNTTEEQLTAARDYNTNQNEGLNRQDLNKYRGAELGLRGKQLGIEGARLGLEQKRFQATTGAGVLDNGQVTPSAEAMAQQIAAYKAPPITGRAATSGLGATVMGRVAQINKDYDQGTWITRKDTLNDFSPKGASGKQAIALNTYVRHTDDLMNLIPQLNNGSFTPGNAAYQKIRQIFGSDAPTNFDQLKNYEAGEAVKVIRGTGGNKEDEEIARASIMRSASPQQLAGALNTSLQVVGGKMQALNQAARKGKLGDDYTVLDPEARTILQKRGYDPETLNKASAAPKGQALPASVQTAIQNAIPKGAKVLSVKKVSD